MTQISGHCTRNDDFKRQKLRGRWFKSSNRRSDWIRTLCDSLWVIWKDWREFILTEGQERSGSAVDRKTMWILDRTLMVVPIHEMLRSSIKLRADLRAGPEPAGFRLRVRSR